MEDSKLEEYIRHKIDDATVHIHFLKIISTWEVSPRREGAVGTSDAAGIVAAGTSDAAGIGK